MISKSLQRPDILQVPGLFMCLSFYAYNETLLYYRSYIPTNLLGVFFANNDGTWTSRGVEMQVWLPW